MEFTYRCYLDLIDKLISDNYNIVSYGAECEGKRVILRHDVDLDLKKAAEFAKLEKQAGNGKVRSTYFVSISSPFYNLFTKESRSFLREISSCGHEIGLHFDETQYENGEILNQVEREANILSDLTDMPVKTVSMHRPSKPDT